MTIYNYTALKEGSNELVKGKVEANDMRGARQAVRELGLIATDIVAESNYAVEQKKKQRR